MKTNSPLFDRIRVKPDQDRRLRTELPPCEWPRCEAPATHRAPKGRLRANEYWRFCLAHAGEEIVGIVVYAHMLEAEPPILVGAQPALRRAMSRGRLAARPFAGRQI